MGVHVPITQQARAESWKLLWSINNSIAIASRQPLFLPSQDMVIGNYYLTAPPIDNSLSFPMAKKNKSSAIKPISNLALSEPENASFSSSPSYKSTTQDSLIALRHNGLHKMNHYFFSLEEAYQYYLNTAYHFHINTAVWFRFSMVFETSERERPIEITIDKHGNTSYTTKYYEKQLKRNRILGKNAFCFSTRVDSRTAESIPQLEESIRPGKLLLTDANKKFINKIDKANLTAVYFVNKIHGRVPPNEVCLYLQTDFIGGNALKRLRPKTEKTNYQFLNLNPDASLSVFFPRHKWSEENSFLFKSKPFGWVSTLISRVQRNNAIRNKHLTKSLFPNLHGSIAMNSLTEGSINNKQTWHQPFVLSFESWKGKEKQKSASVPLATPFETNFKHGRVPLGYSKTDCDTMVSPFQIVFNKNLKPILLNQIIRSTFGRIEFYYEAFYVSRS